MMAAVAELESSLELSLGGGAGPGGLPPARSRIFKIIVIGDSNVGKTCLTYRFCAGRFPQRTEATIGVDFRERAVTIDGERIKIQLWDTAGQERFRKSMVQHYYRNVHAVVFVYDMTNLASFHSLPSWIEECKQHLLANDIPRILVGNKCDLRNAIQSTPRQWRKDFQVKFRSSEPTQSHLLLEIIFIGFGLHQNGIEGCCSVQLNLPTNF
ncbi:ras-related protein Rab-33B [Alligator mississippiensis]|uniref:Ras-related protein Rab-33B n=1 Tax=Alligator mississippiensis TaxID=8496 RepID=A0A151NH41_ALLMI|nr:ras-related protein Rab-33B [Alligator mississippiensis]